MSPYSRQDPTIRFWSFLISDYTVNAWLFGSWVMMKKVRMTSPPSNQTKKRGRRLHVLLDSMRVLCSVDVWFFCALAAGCNAETDVDHCVRTCSRRSNEGRHCACWPDGRHVSGLLPPTIHRNIDRICQDHRGVVQHAHLLDNHFARARWLRDARMDGGYKNKNQTMRNRVDNSVTLMSVLPHRETSR